MGTCEAHTDGNHVQNLSMATLKRNVPTMESLMATICNPWPKIVQSCPIWYAKIRSPLRFQQQGVLHHVSSIWTLGDKNYQALPIGAGHFWHMISLCPRWISDYSSLHFLQWGEQLALRRSSNMAMDIPPIDQVGCCRLSSHEDGWIFNYLVRSF